MPDETRMQYADTYELNRLGLIMFGAGAPHRMQKGLKLEFCKRNCFPTSDYEDLRSKISIWAVHGCYGTADSLTVILLSHPLSPFTAPNDAYAPIPRGNLE